MLRISIFDILSLLETKLLKFAVGSETEKILKVSITGDRYWGILFAVNINSVSGFFYSKFSGRFDSCIFIFL